MNREPITLDSRRCFTPMQKVRLFERAKGRCELCGTKVRGAWVAGHIKPWAMGGRTILSNGRVEGVACGCAAITHAEHTTSAAKAERMAGRKGQYARRQRTAASWKAAQALPASTRSLLTVLMETPVIREIARMDVPSQSMARIWARSLAGNLFMPVICELICLASRVIFQFPTAGRFGFPT